MIRFEQQVLPFSKPSECGDFACLLETEEGDLVVVGDVGGHGSPRVGGLAQEALAVIESNKNESLTRIYEAVSNIPGLRQFGAVLFAARFSRRMPVFHYLSLGNIRAFLVREGQVRNLAHDDGIIGLQAPPNIHVRLLKLANADQVVITTDGVASVENHLSALATEQGDIAQSIIDRFAYKEDDALCAVVQYRLTDSQFSRQPIQIPDLNVAPAPAKETLADKVIASRLKREGASAPVPGELNERLIPLSEAHLLGGVTLSTGMAVSLHNVLQQLGFHYPVASRVSGLVLELLRLSVDWVKLYVSRDRLQFQIQDPDQVVERVAFLFKRVCRCEKDLVVAEYPLPRPIELSQDRIEELKARLQFHSDLSSYRRMRREQQKDEVIAQQAKLAAMGEMISAIAHQWRQPLNAISLYLQDIVSAFEEGELDAEYLKESVAMSRNQLFFMSQTIDDFRDFFKKDEEEHEFDLVDVVQQTLRLFDAQFKNNDIETAFNYAVDQPHALFGNANHLRQALVNIISNAIDAIKLRRKADEGRGDLQGRVIFDLVVQEAHYQLSIRDNGRGFDDEALLRAFEPYFTTKTSGQGTGIGLYMTKTIIEKQFNGALSVLNQEGACVMLTLPRPESIS